MLFGTDHLRDLFTFLFRRHLSFQPHVHALLPAAVLQLVEVDQLVVAANALLRVPN